MCMHTGENTEHWFTHFMKYVCGKYCACCGEKKKKTVQECKYISGVFFVCKSLKFQYAIASDS